MVITMGDTFQEEVRKDLRALKSEMDYIKGLLEDTHLNPKERKFVDSRIKKIKAGDTSDFVSWKDAKKKLG